MKVRAKLLATMVLVAGTVAVVSMPGQPPPGTRSWAEERVERLATHLGLSETQKQNALGLFLSVEKAAEPLEKDLARARKDLREAIRNNAAPQQIDQISALIGSLTGQITAIEAKNEAAFYQLLTPEQRKEYDKPIRGRGRGPGR